MTSIIHASLFSLCVQKVLCQAEKSVMRQIKLLYAKKDFVLFIKKSDYFSMPNEEKSAW